MKLNKIMILAIAAALLATTGCDEPIAGIEPEHILTIIKFNKPAYKDYIMVKSPSAQQQTITMQTSGFVLPDSVFKAHGQYLFGQSPYFELADNYLLIDWKWGDLYYPNCEAVVNELWTDFHSFETYWTLDKLLANRPVAECYYIYPKDIYRYDPTLEHNGVSSPYFQRYIYDVRAMDSHNAAYMEYIPVLSRMISEGKLKKYARKVKLRKR